MTKAKPPTFIGRILLIAGIAGLLLVDFALSQSVVRKKLTPREIAQENLPSTVSILARNSNSKKIMYGSGFFIAPDIVVTSYHVVENATEIAIRPYLQNREFQVSRIGARDEKNDLVLLNVRETTGKPLRLSANDSAAIGDEVFVASNPEGLEGTFSQGIISSIRKLNGNRLIQITAPISHGSSGGAVLNTRGEVIGVAVGSVDAGQSLNFAVPVSFLRSVILAQNQSGWVSNINDLLRFGFQNHPLIQQSVDYYRGQGQAEMEMGLYRSGMFMSMARRIFRDEGVPENIAWLGQILSGWKSPALSSNSASGLWQFNLITGARYGLRRTAYVDERNSLDEATRAVARYLKFLYNRYDNWELAMAAYICGESNVDRAVKRADVANLWSAFPYLPRKTRNYVPNVLATILIANNPQGYGFGHVRPAPSLRYDRIRVPASTNLSIIAQASDTSVQYLRYLNPHFRSNVTPPEPYIINVPLGKADAVLKVFRKSPGYDVGEVTSANAVQDETWESLSKRTGVIVAELKAANPGMANPVGKIYIPIETSPVRRDVSLGSGSGSESGSVRESGDSITPPRIISKATAPYTDAAKRNNVSGKVVLVVTFLASGEIGDIEIRKGLDHGLTESAINAARQIKFVPAMQGGKAITQKQSVSFTFCIYENCDPR